MRNFKKTSLFIFILMLCVSLLNAQTIVDVSGSITTTTTWSPDNIYILNGFVYVKDGGILIIQPGTIIRGDKDSKGSLIITRDGVILANGTAEQPIVFTSNQPEGSRAAGDWGGVIILGDAPINVPGDTATIEGGVDNEFHDADYGGTDPTDSRGGLSYVRIEFPGIAFLPNNEINGLTMGGVGSGTILDHIMVSYSGDDSFEFFGGTVNAKYLIANKGLDDDFDTDNGYSGKLQFIVSQRDKNIADVSGSNGFESDNDATGSDNTPYTSGIISNATIIGPIQTIGDVINSNFKRGAHLRRNTQLNIHNSVLAGWPSGIMVDGTNTETNATNETLEVKNTVIANNTNNFELAAGSVFDISTWFNTPAFANAIYATTAELNISDPYNYTGPDFRPASTSDLLEGAGFTDDVFTGDAFFDKTVSYRGAFSENEDWTACWANWDPQNTDYSTYSGGTVAPTVASFNVTGVAGSFTVNFENTSTGATGYFWTFGDAGAFGSDTSSLENPEWTYPGNGSYEVTLIAFGCSTDTLYSTIEMDSTGVQNVHDINSISQITAFPNPVSSQLNIKINMAESVPVSIQLMDLSGRIIKDFGTKNFNSGINNSSYNVSDIENGMYLLQFNMATYKKQIQLVVLHE